MDSLECSTGIDYLDQLLGELRIGDNIVWEIEAGSYVDLFTEKFSKHSLSINRKLIYISFNRSPATMIKRLAKLPNHEYITLLDCFTSGKGDNDPTFNRFYEENPIEKIKVVEVDNPSDVSSFIKGLSKIGETSGEGARYVFDSLTGIQDLWGDEVKTYKFFTYACPRLYDLNTVAYWIMVELITKSFDNITPARINWRTRDTKKRKNGK
ncbi:MAG: RAD55 family ATPase [bacterium]